MPIYFTRMPSPLGVITLSSDGEILTGLTLDGIPSKDAIEDRIRMKRFVAELNEYLRGERKKFSFKVDQPGTPFQKHVWKELQRIPYGKTISYGELAERVGRPKAYRAAGTANGKNQIAIVIPCHRVIASGGKLGGYGGGLWRKEWLLNLESKN